MKKVKCRAGTTVWGCYRATNPKVDDGYVNLTAGTTLAIYPSKKDVLATRCRVKDGPFTNITGWISLEDIKGNDDGEVSTTR